MNPLSLALRNVFAHRRRNIVILVVVSIVCAVLFLILSFSEGELENIKYGLNTFGFYTSDIRIVRNEFKELRDRGENETLDLTIRDYQGIRDSLKKMDFVEEAYAYNWSPGSSVLSGGESYPYFSLRCVDIPNETYLTSRYTVSYGRDLGPDDRFTVLFHDSMRKATPIREGDRVRLKGTDFFGQVFSQDVLVAGFYKPTADNPNIYYRILCDDATRSMASGYVPGEVNGIEIRLKKGVDRRVALESLNTAWQGEIGYRLKAYDADELRGVDFYSRIFETFKYILMFVSLLIIGIVSFGIMNVVSVNLYDRRKEIGTYYCLGSEKPFLTRIYAWEIIIVNISGAVAGIAAGFILRAAVNALKLATDDPGIQTVLGGSVFYLGFSWWTPLLIIGGITAISAVTALATLRKSLKVSPISAIRETE